MPKNDNLINEDFSIENDEIRDISNSKVEYIFDKKVIQLAEEKIISALLSNNNVYDDVFLQLESIDFSDSNLKVIFSVMKKLYDQSKNIDYISVAEMITSNPVDWYVDIKDLTSYLLRIINNNPFNFGLKNYIDIVKDASIIRRLQIFSSDLRSYRFDLVSFDQQIFDLQQKFNNIVNSKNSSSIKLVSKLIEITRLKLQKFLEDNEDISGVTSGNREIDTLTSGWQPGDLIILAARPGKGKTALALVFLIEAAKTCVEDEIVVFFSLEMGLDQIIQRMVTKMSRTSFTLNRANRLSEDDLSDINEAFNDLEKLPIYIDDSSDITISEIQIKLKQLSSSGKKIKLVVVDYLQLIRGSRLASRQSRQEEVSFVSRALKWIAKTLQVPVIACAQLSRKVEERRGANSEPMLSDLRESGAIEQDADLVSFLYYPRDSQTDIISPSDLNNFTNFDEQQIPCVWMLEKHRNGPVGNVRLIFNKSLGLFTWEK